MEDLFFLPRDICFWTFVVLFGVRKLIIYRSLICFIRCFFHFVTKHSSVFSRFFSGIFLQRSFAIAQTNKKTKNKLKKSNITVFFCLLFCFQLASIQTPFFRFQSTDTRKLSRTLGRKICKQGEKGKILIN